MSQIAEALDKLFRKHRLIFWYDEGAELRDQYEAATLPGVEKVHVQADEFRVKHLVVPGSADRKFLLYFTRPRPEHPDNWLLDLELAHYIFHTDQEAMFLQELGLDYHFKDLVSEHLEFFRSKERRARLKDLLDDAESHRALRYKLLAVVFGVDYVNLETFLQAHAAAFADGNEQPGHDLARFNLLKFYWREVARKYNYEAETPGIYDFLIKVFAHNFGPARREGVSRESRILLSLWKDSRLYQEAFRELSGRIAGALRVEDRLNETALPDLLEEDLFQLVDQRIISELARQVAAGEISHDRLAPVLKKRGNKYWHADFQHYYACIEHASALIGRVRAAAAQPLEAFEAGIRQYSEQLFRPDYHYRRFIRHYRLAGQNKALAPLADKVVKVYANDWLLALNDRWQGIVDRLDAWPVDHPACQRQFFARQVKPFLEKGRRLFVIISDAFRYECGWELVQEIQAERRFEAGLEYAFTGIPSYTQLGMAALLPHRELSIKPESGAVLADGVSTQGIQGRGRVLQAAAGVRAAAVTAEEVMQMTASTEGREFAKQYDLIYIYHNRIDKTGDDKTTEDKVFEAADEEIRFLQELIRKIAAMNGNNILITADHGFMFQYQPLEESDFSGAAFEGEVWNSSRRYVIGKNLHGDAGTRAFSAAQAGLAGDGELLIPKSVNRLRVRGAGSRYVHGGAALQEIVVPLVRVNVKRADTTRQVDVDIIKSTDKITTNLLAVSFLQAELVSEKVLPRTIRAALFAEDGSLLSDRFSYTFDIPEGSERQREVKHRFHISSVAGNKYKNQRVRLLLEEPVEGTNQWKEYKTYSYTLNISFTSDFDDF